MRRVQRIRREEYTINGYDWQTSVNEFKEDPMEPRESLIDHLNTGRSLL